MKVLSLTKNEQDVLKVLREDNRVSMRDICRKLNKPSATSVFFLLHSLEKKGEIKIEGNKTNKKYILLKPYSNEIINFGSRFFGQYLFERNGTI